MATNFNADISAKLNTSDPEQLIYQNELLQLAVLGGIRLDGLDRMRSTLKVQLPHTSASAEMFSVPLQIRNNNKLL